MAVNGICRRDERAAEGNGVWQAAGNFGRYAL
jgi:hypothetical protein